MVLVAGGSIVNLGSIQAGGGNGGGQQGEARVEASSIDATIGKLGTDETAASFSSGGAGSGGGGGGRVYIAGEFAHAQSFRRDLSASCRERLECQHGDSLIGTVNVNGGTGTFKNMGSSEGASLGTTLAESQYLAEFVNRVQEQQHDRDQEH